METDRIGDNFLRVAAQDRRILTAVKILSHRFCGYFLLAFFIPVIHLSDGNHHPFTLLNSQLVERTHLKTIVRKLAVVATTG